ncbi:MAG TPA: LemA family protein [Myxococcota bacterium]|nr:LemA family protein [Myxococcota bacterium]
MHSVWIIGGAFVLFALWMHGVDWRWLAAGGAALLALAFNSIVSARNQAEKAWAGIEAMLTKRFDLIPNLVDAVQRYVEHESDLLREVTALRGAERGARAGVAEAAAADAQTERVLSRLVATAEAYPELKASESFRELQRALNEVEEQLSAARRAYNAAVQHYNDSLRMVPTGWIARLAGFEERPSYEAPALHEARPDVGERFRGARRP